MDRRTLLTGLAAGAAGALSGAGTAEALPATKTTSILLFHRTTGAWRVLVPASLTAPGTSVSGTNATRFRGIVAAAGVERTFGMSTAVQRGILALRGTATTTPTWEVSGYTGTGWVRRNGGNLTFNGAPWVPTGQMVESGGFDRLTVYGVPRQALLELSLTAASPTAFRLRILRTGTSSPAFNTNYTFAASPGRPEFLYGMLPGGMASFANADTSGSRALIPLFDKQLPTLQGHVYGPILTTGWGWVLLVYDRTSGLADVVQLSDAVYRPVRVLRRFQLAVGWTHVVPFRYGFFFYNRTRRLAQLATIVRTSFQFGGVALSNGYLWSAGSLPDFTDAIGF